jgi:hypothetical protein
MTRMYFHRRTLSRLVALLMAAFILAGMLPVAAQSTEPASTPEPSATRDVAFTPVIELVGLVEAVTPGSITVNGQIIDITSAEINQLPVVGAAVKVEGNIDAAGQIVAFEVRAIDLRERGLQPGEIELVGRLTAMNSQRLTIAGFLMDMTRAEIYPGVGLGALVKVHAMLDAQGNWIVREVEPASADDLTESRRRSAGEFEVTGTLTEVGDGFIVVSGRRIDTRNAEMSGLLVPGALVKVHLSIVNGAWVAREAELARSGRDDRNDDSSGRGSDDDHSSDDLSGRGSDDDHGSDDSDSHDSDDDHGSDDSDSHDSDDDHGSDDSDSHDSNDDHGSDDSGDDD